MLPAFFGSDGSFPLQFAIIFVVIFAVLAALVLLIRRFTGRGPGSATKSGSLPRQPRLGIVDVYELDRQRQLILLRRDNVEHLLLVGGPNDVVVERNIGRGPAARFTVDEPVPEEDPVEAAPNFPPPPPREAAFPLREPTFPPREASPPVRDIKVPEFIAERRAIDGPSPAEPPVTTPFVVPPSFDPQPPSAPLRADRNDDTVTVPAAARREPQPARLLRRTPPPLVNMKPDVASERSRASEPSPAETPSTPAVTATEPDFEAAFAAALAEPVPVSAPMPPAVTRANEPAKMGKVDAGILSDMARQLEEALRRPSPGVTPPPSTVTAIPAVDLAPDPAPAEPPPAEPPVEPTADIPQLPPPSVPEPVDEAPVEVPADPREPEPSTDPMAAAMASAADTPPDGDGLFEESPKASEPELPAAPESETKPEPEPQPAPPVPPSSKPPASPAGTNPFSVEEIEAEFARLLGRPLDRKN